MSNGKVRGRFVWHELMTSDPKAAAKFYPPVIGWKTQTWPQNPSYTMFASPTGAMAGYMQLPEEAKKMGAAPHWLSYIGTPDVDRTVRQVEELGGRVLKPTMEVPSVGRFAILQDPQGAVFAAFTPSSEGTGDGKPTLGDFSWHELITTDWEAAFEFYRKLFGWEKTSAMDMGDMGTYQMYGWKDQMLGGMFNKPKNMPAPPHWLPYILVKDSKTAAATAKNRGAQIINGPMEVPGGSWIAQGIDPQGVMFAVHSMAPEAAPASTKKATAKKASAKKPKAKKAGAKKATRKATKKKGAKKTAKKAAKKGAKKKATRRPAGRKKAASRKKGARKAAGRRKPAAKKKARARKRR
jgi:predicted enzyme related to lactoylglutathione lyase